MRLIDADVLTESNELATKLFVNNLTPYIKVDDLLEFVDNLPTIEVVPVVHGEWKQCFEDWRMQIEGDECSVCGYQQYGGVNGFNFCPNCGAKMDKE